jgi:hypothetical protein
MREALQQYVKRIQDRADHVRGNEQATKQSLVGPLFTLLGYDLTEPTLGPKEVVEKKPRELFTRTHTC